LHVPRTPSERSLAGRIGAHALHAKYDTRELTERGRAKFLSRFDDEVDPDRKLNPAERARRAEHARKAYFTKLALASARARRAKKSPNATNGAPTTKGAAVLADPEGPISRVRSPE
jgi:hypothetical protein